MQNLETLESVNELLNGLKAESAEYQAALKAKNDAEIKTAYTNPLCASLIEKIARTAVTEVLVRKGYEVFEGHFNERGQRIFNALVYELQKERVFWDYITNSPTLLNTEAKVSRWLRGVEKQYNVLQGAVKEAKTRKDFADRVTAKYALFSAAFDDVDDAIAATATALKCSVEQVREVVVK